MRKFISFIVALPLVTTLLTGCGSGGSAFSIEGSFDNIQGGELYIFNLSDDFGGLDTVKITEGTFTYSAEAGEEVTPYVLVFPNAIEQVIFASAGQTIKYKVEGSDLRNYVVTGSDENELLSDFRKSVASLEGEKLKEKAEKFIKENKSSIVSVYLFDRYFVQSKSFESDKLNTLLAIIKKAQPNNQYLMNVESKIKLYKKSNVGCILHDVQMVTKSKDSTYLWREKKEKNTVVLFWASWSSASIDMLWKMRNFSKEHRDSISARFVGFSLDTEYFTFESLTRTDSIYNVEQYCDGQSFESDVVKQFGIPSLPYYVITDKKHKVMSHGTEIKQLEKDMKKYLKR